MPKVYILNRGAHDYSKAKRFGELVYVSDGMIDKTRTGTMFRMVQDAFKYSQPDDYILLSSLTTLCCIASAIFANRHKRLNLLIYGNDDYLERNLILGDDNA